MLSAENLDKALRIRSSLIKGVLSLGLFIVYWISIYLGSNCLGPFLNEKPNRTTILKISTEEALAPAREELSLFGMYVNSLLEAATPIFYTMGFFGLLAALLTHDTVLINIRKAIGLPNVEKGKQDPLKESIYVLIEFVKVKLGAGYFLPTLICVIFGGFTIGTSIFLIFAQKLAGLSSFIVAILSMLVLVIFALVGFKRASIDLRKATILSSVLSLLFAVSLSIYGIYDDFKTKKNIFKLSETVVELLKENKELNEKLKRLEP